VFGGRLKSFDDKEARGIAGVRDVFEIPLAKAPESRRCRPVLGAKQARDR